jgi:hypothetical protein
VAFIVALVGASVWGFADHPATTKTLALVDIDGYPASTRVTGCADPMGPKPGVADFRTLILSQVGGFDDGLAGCKQIANDSGAYSDHADGRAWDWRMRAASAVDRAKVDRVLNWLLRTDERGHRNANARRLGMTYIIWNHQYYRVGSDNATWVPYTSTSDPHDGHVHFSFSVAGATQRTSWWSERRPLIWSLQQEPPVTLVYGESGTASRPLAGDWDGDGRDTVGLYNPADRRFYLRNANSSGEPTVLTPPIGPFGAIPLVGNWDGLGGDELGVYDPTERRFSFFTIEGIPGWPEQVLGTVGDLPLAGDWNGDGVDEVGTYTPDTGTFSLQRLDGSIRTEVFGTARDTPLIGDWNGDRADEIGVFRASANTLLLPGRTVQYGTTRQVPVIGDWNGDRIDTEAMVTTNPR